VTVLRNNFDTGPDGTQISIANSSAVPGNNAFDTVGGTASGTILYSANFSRQTAVYTAHLASGATAAAPCVGWSTSMGSQSQIWFREYVLLTAYPPGDKTVFECDNGTTYNSFIAVLSGTSRFSVLNSAQSILASAVTSLTLNQWYRLEGRFQYSATTGNWELDIYQEADSDTPTERLSGSNCNFGAASSNSWLFGYAFSETSSPDLYISGLELNNTGFPGPAPFRQGLGTPSGNLTNPIAIHMD
jgi:hypothetical protein